MDCLCTYASPFRVVGPKALISALGQCGGFLDGGAAHPLQIAAIPLLDYERVKQDRVALQRHFKEKRDHVLGRLTKMGFELKNAPNSTFYVSKEIWSAVHGFLTIGLSRAALA